MTCPNCGQHPARRNGKDRHGNQRFICPGCGKTFNPLTRPDGSLLKRLELLEAQHQALQARIGCLKQEIINRDIILSGLVPNYITSLGPEEIPF